MKKFIDNARHDEPWFVELPIEMKAAYDFLWAKCDAAGVWNGSTRIADIQLGKRVDWQELERKSGGRLVRLSTGAFYFPEYVAFQCGVLNEGCPPHRTVIKLLRSHGLMSPDSLTVRLTGRLLGSPQEEEEETEEEKARDAERRQKLDQQQARSIAFEVFWNDYPRKEKKSKAREAFEKVDADISVLLKALEWQKRSHDWTKDGGQYIPQPTSWLNQRRWEDEPFAPMAREGELAGFTMVDPLANPA